MGDVRMIDPLSEEVNECLQERCRESADIDGLVMLTVYKSGRVTCDIKGAFSPDPDDLAKLLGYLDMTAKDLYSIATEEEYIDE